MNPGHRPLRLPALLAALLLLAVLSGCQHAGLGARADALEPGRAAMADAMAVYGEEAIRTGAGLLLVREDGPRLLEARLAVLSPAGVVVAEISVVARQRSGFGGSARTATVLIRLAGMAEPGAGEGPVAQLRAVAEMLRRPQATVLLSSDLNPEAISTAATQAPLVGRGHAMARAGIARVLEALPGVQAPVAELQQLADFARLVPSGGAVDIDVLPAGYQLRYGVDLRNP